MQPRTYEALLRLARKRARHARGLAKTHEQRIAELEAQVTRLEAGMTWLRDYAIGGAIALHTAQHDGELSNERVEQIIGGIEGNIAVAMDRASAKGEGDGN